MLVLLTMSLTKSIARSFFLFFFVRKIEVKWMPKGIKVKEKDDGKRMDTIQVFAQGETDAGWNEYLLWNTEKRK